MEQLKQIWQYKEFIMNITQQAALFYHKLYKSNFYMKPKSTQDKFETALKEFLDDIKRSDN